jgi:hypothetical protein
VNTTSSLVAQTNSLEIPVQTDAPHGAVDSTTQDGVSDVAAPLAVGDALSKRDTAKVTVGEADVGRSMLRRRGPIFCVK